MAWRGKAPEGRTSLPTRSRYSNMKYHIYTEYETQNLQPIHNFSPSESRSHSPLVEELLSPKFHSDSTIRNSRSFGMNTLLSSAKVSPERSTSMSGKAANVACKAVSPVTSIIHTVNTAVSPFNIIGTTDNVRSVKTRFKSKVSSCESIERPLIENISVLTQPVRPINAVRSISPAQRSIRSISPAQRSKRSISPAQKSVRSISSPISRSAAVRTSSSLKITPEPITKTINSVPKRIPSSTAKLKKMDWVSYHRLQTIHNFLDELESEFPALCTVGTIGNSIEGRPIKVLKISNSNANNLSVWIDAGIHAREWIGPAVNTYVANHIARNFKNLPASVTEKDWYFLPVANPDGYEYTHTGDRMWRKNRAKQAGKYVGVDLNRNFSFNWGGKGSSDRATHCFYRGPEPFSEPESSAIRDMIEHSGARFLIYITLHSFGQVIIFPFASQDDLCPDYIRLLEGATVMSKSIETIKVAPAQEKIQVWEVKLDREGQRFLIRNLDTSGAVNIWKEEMSTMDIMVDGSRAAQVASLLHEHDIPYSIAIGDVAVLMEKEHDTSKPSKSLPQGVKMDWTKYHRLATINTFMEDLAKEFPYLCTVNVIGRTHEGRDMMMLKISNGNADNYGVWMDATIHPREWISTAVVTYIADQIARRFYSLPTSVTNKDWYILPVLNPDGYEYTHTQDRMWRKNRGRFGECIGVDLNRNWSNGWGEKGEEGSSDDPGSIFYRGTEPFSEPETDAIRRTITTSDTQFKVFLSFHSYGEVIIFPWGYTSEPCPDYVELLEGGTAMAKAIHETSGHTYKVGSTKDLMYYACGTSVDWSYGTAHIPYSYMVELRSKKHRFLLPKEDIIPTAKEVYNGLLRLMQFVDSRANASASSSKT